MKSRLIHTQVFSDALPLEGVPTGVTMVANRCVIKNHCISCMYESINHGLMCVMIDIYGLRMLEYVSTLKKKLPTIFSKESALIPLVIYDAGASQAR
jgi:hypothetical protein